MSNTTTSEKSRRIYFVLEEDRYAIAWLLAHAKQCSITDQQLSVALHVMGLVADSKTPARRLAFRTMEKRTGWSRQLCMKVSVMLMDAGLLQQVCRSSGGTGVFAVGPAFDGDDYRMHLEHWNQHWKSGVTWPITSRARKASWHSAAKRRSQKTHDASKGVVVSEVTGGGCLRTTGGVVTPETTGVVIPETTTLRTGESCPLETLLEISLEGEPQAEAEQQACGPAVIPEQPTANELAGAVSELAGAGQGMTIQQTALYQQQQYNKQKLEGQQQRDLSNIKTTQNSSTPELRPWDGPPVEELNEGDMLQHVDGTIAFVDVRVDRHGREIWLCECTQDLTGLTGSMIQVFAPEHLKGWFIVESQQVDGIVSSSVESDEAEAASVLIPTGSRITVDGSLAELITIGSDWDESPDADTVLAHPPGEPSAMKRYKINTITVL